MRYAITCENNEVFQHFGKTPAFMMVDIEDGNVMKKLVFTEGKGHGALAGFLQEQKVNTLVCGGIGQGARDALTVVHIDIISGAKGLMDDVIEAICNNSLKDDPSGRCNHHHDGANHSCASH